MTAYQPSLLQAASDGDHDAIAALVKAAQIDVRRFARRSCRSSNDIEDAVQETLFILYRHVGALRKVGSLSAWLFAVVKRECARLGKAFLGGGGLAAVEDDLRFASRPQDDLRLDLVSAIQSLPPHYRDVVLLRDFEELTIGEIANALGASREAVKARLNRARTLLREYLSA